MTTAETLLMRCLKFFPIKTGRLIQVMLLTDTEEKRWEMISFLENKLRNNQDASEEEILDKAWTIAEM